MGILPKQQMRGTNQLLLNESTMKAIVQTWVSNSLAGYNKVLSVEPHDGNFDFQIELHSGDDLESGEDVE